MKTRILLPIMAVSILAGCKEDDPTWEESVRDSFNYKITINVEQDAGKTVYIWPIGCYPVEKKGNFYFSGLACDFVLANAKQNEGSTKIQWESDWGESLIDYTKNPGDIDIHTYQSGCGYVLNRDLNTFVKTIE